MMEPLESWTGLVILPAARDSFRSGNETIARLEQPPQFFPRLQWPTPAIGHANLPTYPLDLLDGNAAQIAQLHQQVVARYGHLRPMLPFEANVEQTYRGWDWRSHAAVLHEMLRGFGGGRGRDKPKPLTRKEVMALETICSYGLYDKVAFLDPWELAEQPPPPAPVPQQAPPPPQPARTLPGRRARNATPAAPAAPAPALPATRIPWTVWNHSPAFDEELIEGSYSRANHPAERNAMYRAIEGRRFVVAPVVHGPIWSMSIFDRVNAELYIFDCFSINRESRVQGIVHLWMKYWNWLGICQAFQYFVPKTHRVAEFADTGYKSILWLFQNIRNQVGEQILVGHVEGEPRIPRRDVRMVIKTPRPPIQDSSMYIHDALPTGMNSAVSIWPVAKRMLTVLLCNELGLANHREISSRGRRAGEMMPMVLIQALAGSINTQTRIPRDDYFRYSGGPQFVAHKGARFEPYDVNQPRAFILGAADPAGVLISNNPPAYVTPVPQAQQVIWQRRLFYNQLAPVDTEDIEPTEIQPQDERDTPTYREFYVAIDRLRPGIPSVPLCDPLVLSFSQIARANLPNGGVGIQFQLNAQSHRNAAVEGDAVASTIVHIPVPDDNYGNDSEDSDNGDDDDANDDFDVFVDEAGDEGDDGNGGSSHGSGTNPNTPRGSQGSRANKGPTTPNQSSRRLRSRNTSEASTVIKSSPSNDENRRPRRYNAGPPQAHPASTGDPGPSQRRRRLRGSEDSPDSGPSKRLRSDRSSKSPPGGGGSSGTRAPLAPM